MPSRDPSKISDSKNKSKITLQDIADALGISRGTVDRAVHNRGRISEETRKKILDKAAALGYIDDKISRFTTLKTKSGILALFPESPSFFYDIMKQGLQNAMAEQNDSQVELKIIDYKPDDPDGFLNILKSSVNEDGLKAVLLVPSGHFDPSLSLPGADRIPYITINTDLPGSRRKCFIGQDLYQSGRLGGELIHKFCSRGNFLVLSGYRGLWAHDERVRGVLDSLAELGSDRESTVLYCDDDVSKAEELLKESLESHNDIGAVISLTAAATLGTVHGLNSMALKRKIALVGFDFNKELSAALDEGHCDVLIGQNPEEQGAWAFKLIYQVIINSFQIPREHYITPTELFFKELKPSHSISSEFLK